MSNRVKILILKERTTVQAEIEGEQVTVDKDLDLKEIEEIRCLAIRLRNWAEAQTKAKRLEFFR